MSAALGHAEQLAKAEALRIHLQLEAAQVPTRLGFKVALDGGYYGGPLRLALAANDADMAGEMLALEGDELMWSAIDHIMTIDWDSPNASWFVVGFFSEYELGFEAESLPGVWCYTTSWDSSCPASDAIVPTDRQGYPSPSAPDVLIIGPAHNQETKDLSIQVALGNALATLP